MEIQRIYSEVDTEERLYSVLMNEEELALFSEYQKEFARKDYEGLSKKNAEKLKKFRDEMAKNLLEARKRANESFAKNGNLEARNMRHSFNRNVMEDGTAFQREILLKNHKLMKRGKIALGVAATAGLGYGAKKLYDRNKEKEN